MMLAPSTSLLKPDEDPTALHIPSANGPTGTVPRPSTSPQTGATTLQPPKPLVGAPPTSAQPTPASGPAPKPVTTAQTPGLTPQNSTVIAPGTAQSAPALSPSSPGGAPVGTAAQTQASLLAAHAAQQPTNGDPNTPAPMVQPPPNGGASGTTPVPVSGAASTVNDGLYQGGAGQQVSYPDSFTGKQVSGTTQSYTMPGGTTITGIPYTGPGAAAWAAKLGVDPSSLIVDQFGQIINTKTGLTTNGAKPYGQNANLAAPTYDASGKVTGSAPLYGPGGTSNASGQNFGGTFAQVAATGQANQPPAGGNAPPPQSTGNPMLDRYLQGGVSFNGAGQALDASNGNSVMMNDGKPVTLTPDQIASLVRTGDAGTTVPGIPMDASGKSVFAGTNGPGVTAPSAQAFGQQVGAAQQQPLVGAPVGGAGGPAAGGSTTPPVVGAPPSVTGTNGATPDSLSSSLLQKTQDYLNNPSIYDDALFKRQEDLAKQGLDQQYNGLEDNLKADLAQRGLDYSTIAAGKLGDFATNKGNAWQNIVTQMLTDRANGMAGARAQAFGQANTEQGYNAAQDQTAFERAMQTMQAQQGADAQRVAEQQGWAQLGLSALNTAQQNALLQATGASNLSSATSSQLADMAKLAAEFFGNAGTNTSAPSSATPIIRPPTGTQAKASSYGVAA